MVGSIDCKRCLCPHANLESFANWQVAEDQQLLLIDPVRSLWLRVYGAWFWSELQMATIGRVNCAVMLNPIDELCAKRSVCTVLYIPTFYADVLVSKVLLHVKELIL